MKRKKPQTWWVIKTPSGEYLPRVFRTRMGAIANETGDGDAWPWSWLYKDGWRAVEIRPVEVRRKKR